METYSIIVRGDLEPGWSIWFGGLTVRSCAEGRTELRGTLVDQAALHGVLARVRDLNLDLISVTKLECEGKD